MEKVLELLNLADMLKTVDLEKNDTETIQEVLNFVASKIEDYVNSLGGEK